MTAADATTRRPSALGGYEDWPGHARGARHSAPRRAAQEIADALGVPAVTNAPGYTVLWEEMHDDVITSQLTWQLGFGPATTAWFVRPAHAAGPLPGVLALHCHGGVKHHGAARLVQLPGHVEAGLELPPLGERSALYGGRPLATWLAKQGFAVLAHDAFLWGSRRFALDPLPYRTAGAVSGQQALWREAGVVPTTADLYNAAAGSHEETVAKAAALLGTSVAGTVAHDDLAALEVLGSLPGVDPERLGCLGFSGGGGRALVLSALSPAVRSYVVTCMMTTYESLLPAYLDAHSWLLHSSGLAAIKDWPDLAVTAAGQVLVQYALADPLFPAQGMRDADALLLAQLAGRYTGTFWNEAHVFSPAMQEEAAAFLAAALQVQGTPTPFPPAPARTSP